MRKLNLVSARRFAPDDHFRQMHDTAERLVSEPFTGVTSDGNVIPGLYPLKSIGISTEPIRRAALEFLDTLDAVQQTRVSFDIDSDAWRRSWNIHAFLMRHGLMLDDLNVTQRAAALRLLEQTCSERGFRTARDIMRLNHTIGVLANDWEAFGEQVYFVSMFGQPSDRDPWDWQIDGHHLNVNCFIMGDQIVITPMFIGSEPVTAETGRYPAPRCSGPSRVRRWTSCGRLARASARRRPPDPSADLLPSGRGPGSDGRIHAAAFREQCAGTE